MSQKNSAPSVLIMAGGTGGHIFPGVAVANCLIEMGWKVHWLGAIGGMEEEIIAKYPYELHLIQVKGLRGNGLLGWFKVPFSLTLAVIQSIKAIKKSQPAVVIGFGGFASGPGGIAASLMKKTLVIHEQNAIAGLTNKALAKFASKIFQGFPDTFQASEKVKTVGNPVRKEMMDNQIMCEQELAGAIKILVVGGSRGALALNKKLPTIFAPLLAKGLIKVRHQVGKGRLLETQKIYQESQIETDESCQLYEFIDDMAEAMAWSDLVICRAGASTVAEVAAMGLCAIFIPYPYAVDDHQSANASWLVQQDAALMFPESELEQNIFTDTILSLIKNPSKIEKMAKKAKASAYLNAAEQVADYCNSLRANAA